MQQSVIQKYNVPVPRYTSYPPANYFRAFTETEYVDAVRQSNTMADRHVSFYLHMPFCRHLCHYCACNSFAMRSPDQVERYLDALHREADLLLPLIDGDRRVSQIHYGGGSPTAVSPTRLRRLNARLLSALQPIGRPEIAIECHPGYLSLADWRQLCEAGFTRFSIGIQDLNAEVLRGVNRRPSQESVADIFRVLRDAGAGINLDFLYGLPGQTADSFRQTIEQAIALGPDRLVTFSYAHVPWLMPRQKVLERAGLPQAAEKEQMAAEAARLLAQAGYVRIGMDHFVRPGDELAQALRDGRLHRNFQGYCTRRTTAQVYALGVTGISQLETAYAQNVKDIDAYVATVESGHLPVSRGYSLSVQERQTRQQIDQLMCNYHTVLTPAQQTDAQVLQLQADGLIALDGAALTMTADGLPFVRNVAAALDPLMRHNTKAYSRPI